MSKETGGPAFPQSAFWTESDNPYDSADFGGRGMTLRDHFAGLAMQGDMSFDPLSPGIDYEKLQKYASHYYRIADAMLRARGE